MLEKWNKFNSKYEDDKNKDREKCNIHYGKEMTK